MIRIRLHEDYIVRADLPKWVKWVAVDPDGQVTGSDKDLTYCGGYEGHRWESNLWVSNGRLEVLFDLGIDVINWRQTKRRIR